MNMTLVMLDLKVHLNGPEILNECSIYLVEMLNHVVIRKADIRNYRKQESIKFLNKTAFQLLVYPKASPGLVNSLPLWVIYLSSHLVWGDLSTPSPPEGDDLPTHRWVVTYLCLTPLGCDLPTTWMIDVCRDIITCLHSRPLILYMVNNFVMVNLAVRGVTGLTFGYATSVLYSGVPYRDLIFSKIPMYSLSLTVFKIHNLNLLLDLLQWVSAYHTN